MKRIDEILIDCLRDIESGKATIEDCLERHPALRGELEPLLRLAVDIERLPAEAPSAGFRSKARANVMEYAHEHPLKHSQRHWLANIFIQPGWARSGVIVLAVLVIIAGSATGTAYAAQSSLPGDLLYPVKTGTESWREWIETDAAGDTLLQMEFAGRRIDELERLIPEFSPDVYIAVSGYENNLNKAITYSDNVAAGAFPEEVASGILNQLNRLDLIEEVSGDPGIVEAERIAVNGHIRVLRRISGTGPVKAGEMTAASLQNRLEKAAGAAARGDIARAENALRLFNRYAGLGEEILDGSEGTIEGTTVESIFRKSARNQQALFDSFSSQVSSQVANEVRMSFQKMERHHGGDGVNEEPGPGGQNYEPGSQGQEPGNQNEEPGNQNQETGNQNEEPGNQNQEPGKQNEEQGNQNEDPGNQGQSPGNQEEEPVNPGQPVGPGQGGGGNGGGNSPGMPQNG